MGASQCNTGAPAGYNAPDRPGPAKPAHSSNIFMMTCGMCSTPAPADRAVSSLPDFTGEWVCFACDGDVDSFLAEMGVGLLARLAARVRQYDIGNIVRVFKQIGNDLDIDVRGRRRFTQMLRIGGGQQVCEDEDGAVLVEPVWERRGKEGFVLCFEVTEQDGSKPRTARHWIAGNELTIEYTTRTACCVKWRYRRCGGHWPKPVAMPRAPSPPAPHLMRNGIPNFSGTWNSYACDGDLEGFFEEMGIGKAGRTAMSTMNYGVGMIEKVIVQNDDEIQITDAWPTGPTTQKFSVGAGEQVTIGTQGREIYVTPAWEHGHVLHLGTQPIDRTQTANGPMRYYFIGEDLILMYESVSGCVVKYLHRRKK